MAVEVRQGETDRPPTAGQEMPQTTDSDSEATTQLRQAPPGCLHAAGCIPKGHSPVVREHTLPVHQHTWSSSMMRRNSDPSLTPSSVCGECWQEYKHMKLVVLHDEARDSKTRYSVSRLLLRRLCKRNAETAHV